MYGPLDVYCITLPLITLTSPPHLYHITLPPHFTPASSVWRLFCTPIALSNRMLPGPGPKYALQRATSLLSEELILCKYMYMATLCTSEGHLQLRLRSLHTTMASSLFGLLLQHTCTVPSEGLDPFNKLFGPSVHTATAVLDQNSLQVLYMYTIDTKLHF